MITGDYDSIGIVSNGSDTLPDDIEALKAALIAERAARQELEARASGAEMMIVHLKLMIAKLNRDRWGQAAERGRKVLDQLEIQLDELEISAAEDVGVAASVPPDTTTVRPFIPARLDVDLVEIRVLRQRPEAFCGELLPSVAERIDDRFVSVE